jgi:membrane protein
MTTIDARLEKGRGRKAERPSQLPWKGWKDVFWRAFAEFRGDRITLIAAGVAFYMLLALFPALAAFVSLYGFVADPVTIADQIAFLGTLLPSGSLDLIRAQLESLATQDQAALSFGFVSGLALAMWSANNGIKTLFEALNVAYEEREKRSFIKLNLVSLLFTLGAIVIGILFIIGVGVVPAMLAIVGFAGHQEALISLLRWPVLVVASTLAISALYRFGPSREFAKWRWVSWGSTISAVLWLVASILFSWYLGNFANYNVTYGSLGAVIGFMMWTWISVVILLAGAEFNAEMEHQTACDSTTGPEKPMGLRGATMADTLGVSHKAGRQYAPEAFDPSRELSRHPHEFNARSKASAGRSSILDALFSLAVPAAVIAVIAVLDTLDRREAKPTRAQQPRTGRIDRE